MFVVFQVKTVAEKRGVMLIVYVMNRADRFYASPCGNISVGREEKVDFVQFEINRQQYLEIDVP